MEARAALGPGGDHGPLPGAGRRLPGHRPARHADRRGPGEFPVRERDRCRACSSSGRRWGSCRPSCAATPSSSAGRRSTSPARLPDAEEVKAFIGRSRPGQAGEAGGPAARLARNTPRIFAIKWADILRNKREGNALTYQASTFNFHDWIRESLAKNMPYDQFVRGILAASGSSETAPPVQWYRKLRETDAFVDDTAQVFLGMRLQCAKCHHHPFEKWSQDDYYGFAAFFARVGRKPDMQAQRSGRDAEVIYTPAVGNGHASQDGRADGPQGTGRERRAGRRRR